jgi:hypothetical protein
LTMVLNSVQPVISGVLLHVTSWWFCFVHVTSNWLVNGIDLLMVQGLPLEEDGKALLHTST